MQEEINFLLIYEGYFLNFHTHKKQEAKMVLNVEVHTKYLVETVEKTYPICCLFEKELKVLLHLIN